LTRHEGRRYDDAMTTHAPTYYAYSYWYYATRATGRGRRRMRD